MTLAELARKHDFHQTMIATWKRQAIEDMTSTFSGEAEASQAASEAETARLHAKIGQLVVELDFSEGLRSMSVERRHKIVEQDDRDLSIGQQCRLLPLSRSTFSHAPTGESPVNLALMRLIDEAFTKRPFYGARQMYSICAVWAMRPSANGPAVDDPDGAVAHLPETPDQRSPSPAPDLSLTAEGHGDHPAPLGLVRRHHLYSDAQSPSVSGGGDGLGAEDHARYGFNL